MGKTQHKRQKCVELEAIIAFTMESWLVPSLQNESMAQGTQKLLLPLYIFST